MLLLYGIAMVAVVWAGVRLIELLPNVQLRDAFGIAWSFAPALAAGVLGLWTECWVYTVWFVPVCIYAWMVSEWALFIQFFWFPVAIAALALSLRRQSRT